MKNIKFIMMMAVAAFAMSSCFKEPVEQGFIGENIYLQGGDTLFVAIGAAKSTEKAWLDNSTKPCTFKIENVRDEEGKRHDGFFKTFPTMLWRSPYDYLTDTTEQVVRDKIAYIDMTPLMINEVNGQLRAMASTSEIGLEPGQVFHVDVSVTNPKGTRYIEDYAIIKFEKGSSGSASSDDFVCTEVINGIAIEADMNGKNDIQVLFPYYEQVNDTKSNWSDLQQQLYEGKEVKGMTIKKISTEPTVGIKFILKFLDADGNLFDPAGYASYTTNQSFITHGLNRQNTSEGMIVEFPLTPWPVTSDAVHLGYTRGPIYGNLDKVDLDALAKAFPSLQKNNSFASWPAADTYPDLQSIFYNEKGVAVWPEGWFETHATGWYVRLRSRFKFNQPGTYELTVKVPYTKAK